MRGTDHVIIEAAAQAKRAKLAKQKGEAPPPKPVSSLDRAITAGIWVAAAGSMAAVMLS